MPFETGLLAYAAFANLALVQKKHRPARPLPVMLTPRRARLLGWALLLASLVVALHRFGAAQGIVAWTGQLCVAGAAFVLLLSWNHRTALLAGLFTPVVALVLALV